MHLELTGHPSDPTVTWRRLGDSDFLNRLAGNGQMEMGLVTEPGGAPRVVGTMAGPLGTQLSFEEEGGWVFQRWFKQVRAFSRSPLARSAFELRLEPDDDAVIPHMTLELEPASRLFQPLLSRRLAAIERAWAGVLDELPRPGEEPSPAVLRPLGREAEAALGAWAERGSAQVVDRMSRLFREGRATELQQLRAFQLADRWGVSREEVLTTLLRGISVGAVELYWSVRCRRCKGEVAAVTSLSDLADHAGCPSCRIEFSTDLGDNVEVLFAPHPAVLPRVEQHFCTVFPAGAPELRAAFRLEPGAEVSERVSLVPGRWMLGGGGEEPDLVLLARKEADPAEVSWEPGRDEERAVRAGEVELRLHNASDAARRVLLIADDPREDMVPASTLTTMAEFRRELGQQVLAPDVRVSTRSVALVFTDLSGSTAMYEALGDAPAYGVVRDHFRVLGDVVEARGGVVVKTIGDAVMASFHSVTDAFGAALEMREAFDRFVTDSDLSVQPRLNVGVHVGPALVVHTDAAGMDYFGRTVNIAARAQGQARDGALVFTEEVRTAPGVQELLLARDGEPERFEAELKGLGATALYRLSRDED